MSLWDICQNKISFTQFHKKDLTQQEKNIVMSAIEEFCGKMEQIELDLNAKGKSSGFYD